MPARPRPEGPSRSRLILMFIVLGIIVPIAPSPPAARSASPDTPRLSTLPEHVYRANDEGKFKTESWYFELVVHDPQLRKWGAESLRLETLSAGRVVKTTTVQAPGLASRAQRLYFPAQGPFNNGGHAHRETMHAIDVMALTPTY